MEYDFTIKHIKGSSNCVADSLSRLPVAIDKSGARYPNGRLQELGDLPQVCKWEQSEDDVMVEVKWLAAQQQQVEVCDVTVQQLVGAGAASGGGSPWDMLPLTCQDIAKATREDPVYGKLVRAVRAGNLNKKDKDL